MDILTETQQFAVLSSLYYYHPIMYPETRNKEKSLAEHLGV